MKDLLPDNSAEYCQVFAAGIVIACYMQQKVNVLVHK